MGELPWLTVLHTFCELLAELSAVQATPLGKDSWKLVPRMSQTLPYMTFSFAGCNLYLLTIISHKHEYNSYSEPCEPFQ